MEERTAAEEIKRGDLVEIQALEDVFFLIVPGRIADSINIPIGRRLDTRNGVFDTERMMRLGVGEVRIGLVVKKVIRAKPGEYCETFYVLVGEEIIVLDPGSPGHGGHYHLEAGYKVRKTGCSSVV